MQHHTICTTTHSNSANYIHRTVGHENLQGLACNGTEPSLWPDQSYGTVFLQQVVTQTPLARSSANSKLTFFLCASTMFDFDFCNALPVQARVGSGTITAIYYYYYYYFTYSQKRVNDVAYHLTF